MEANKEVMDFVETIHNLGTAKNMRILVNTRNYCRETGCYKIFCVSRNCRATAKIYVRCDEIIENLDKNKILEPETVNTAKNFGD